MCLLNAQKRLNIVWTVPWEVEMLFAVENLVSRLLCWPKPHIWALGLEEVLFYARSTSNKVVLLCMFSIFVT